MFGIKYIILNKFQAIIFSSPTEHVSFRVMGEITGAGFCQLIWNAELDGPNGRVGDWEVNVYGKSVSLNMESKEADAAYIKRMLNT